MLSVVCACLCLLCWAMIGSAASCRLGFRQINVDPARTEPECIQATMGADHSPPKSPSKPLMSATGVKKVCGELRATTFPHPKPIAGAHLQNRLFATCSHHQRLTHQAWRAEPQPLFYSETCALRCSRLSRALPHIGRPLLSVVRRTAEYYQKKARQVAVGATTQKRLVPYHMDAPRNRPKEDLSNVVGTRHKLHPCIKCVRACSHA